MGDFKSLVVWQKSVALVTEIYQLTENFPKNEVFGLTSQIRRAAISVPSNIAEGHSRRSTSDYIQFLKISRGSLAELETQWLISKNLNFISEKEFLETSERIFEISKMLNSLITKLNPKP